MKCSRCGAELTGKFCSKCGQAVVNRNQQRPPVQTGYMAQEHAPTGSYEVAHGGEGQRVVKKKNNVGLIAAICALGLVAVVVAVCLIIMIFGNLSNEEKKPLSKVNYDPPIKTVDIDKDNNITRIVEEGEFSLNYDDDSFLYPTDEKYLSWEDLEGLSERDVALLRNEIYARHGYVFSNQEYARFFSNKSWYSPNPYLTDSSMVESRLNECEKENKNLLVEYEKEMGWRN